MTTTPPPEPDQEPHQEPHQDEDRDEEIAALLAALGGALSTPPPVVNRLENTLGALVEERRGGARPAVVVPLPRSPHRSSRRWSRGLLAAAAVVAGGYGVTQLVSSGSLTGAGSSDTTSSAQGEAAQGEAAPDAASGAGEAGGAGRLPSVRADRLRSDVRRVADRATATGDQAGSAKGRRDRCEPPTLGRRDVWYVVRFQGRPAALVVAPSAGDDAEATLYSCTSGARLVSTMLPGGAAVGRP